MNINFKELAKTALVVGALTATLGANALTNAPLQQNAKDVLAACQISDSLFSYQFVQLNRGVANVIRDAVGSKEKLAEVYIQSGACDVIQSYANMVHPSTSYAEETHLANQAVDSTVAPLVDALHTNYAQELQHLFGASMVEFDTANAPAATPAGRCAAHLVQRWPRHVSADQQNGAPVPFFCSNTPL